MSEIMYGAILVEWNGKVSRGDHEPLPLRNIWYDDKCGEVLIAGYDRPDAFRLEIPERLPEK